MLLEELPELSIRMGLFSLRYVVDCLACRLALLRASRVGSSGEGQEALSPFLLAKTTKSDQRDFGSSTLIAPTPNIWLNRSRPAFEVAVTVTVADEKEPEEVKSRFIEGLG